MVTLHILTIFPGMFSGFLGETMMKRGIAAGVVDIHLVDIRKHATDKHKTTDDTPYGGGPGMVMKVEPIYRTLEALQGSENRDQKTGKQRIVLLAPRGKQFTQEIAQAYAELDSLTLICGRYEGVDQRVADHLCDEELSIGPYVLSGGEVAAMVVMETVSRLLPGFLGNPESLQEESFVIRVGSRYSPTRIRDSRGDPGRWAVGGGVEYPQYTKPEDFRGWKVPSVLLSGNHAEITKWRTLRRKNRSRK